MPKTYTGQKKASLTSAKKKKTGCLPANEWSYTHVYYLTEKLQMDQQHNCETLKLLEENKDSAYAVEL